MEQLSPVGAVYQAGTLSGNPLACRAGLALLRLLDDSVYTRLETLGRRLETGLQPLLVRHPGLCFQRVGSMATLFFHAAPVRSFTQVLACDNAAYGRFFREMLHRGHFLPPAQFEAFFLSTAHTESDIDGFVRDIEASTEIALAGETAEKVALEVEKVDKQCPECGKDLLVRTGKFGKFLACSGFPDCKHTEPIVEQIDAKCPQDGGDVMVRKTKKGKTFYGCKNWPKCTYASWTKPVSKEVPSETPSKS
jgi:ssDNA-binding Zn-finger/Zn-ribbon topoisomerase 1